MREALESLAAALTETVVPPCPEVGVRFSHEASLCADQVQSRAAFTVSERVPPSAGTTVDDEVTDAVHRTAPGPVTLVVDVDPQARSSAAMPLRTMN
jgi:hypothetical protein